MHHKKPTIDGATRARIAAIMTVVLSLTLGVLKLAAPLQHQLA